MMVKRTLRFLGVLGVSAVNRLCFDAHRRDAESAETAQRNYVANSLLSRNQSASCITRIFCLHHRHAGRAIRTENAHFHAPLTQFFECGQDFAVIS